MKNLNKSIIRTLSLACLLAVSSLLQGQTKVSSVIPLYGEASYPGLADNEFMKNWLILGPVSLKSMGANPTFDKQKEAFDQDVLTSVEVQRQKKLSFVKIGDSSYNWKLVKSDQDIIDLIPLYGQRNYAVAYALAEIKMDAPAKILAGLGSDDGVKLFLNGKLIHSNWIGRGTVPDDDLVFLNLEKGSNQVLLKVQNMEMGWSFCMRKPGKDALQNLLTAAAGKGNLDNVRLLIENGVDVNGRDKLGLTAYQSAQIRGRDKVMDYLKEKGAKTDLTMPSFNELADPIFKSVQSGRTPGVSVLVSKNGEIIYAKGFGYADVGNRVPMTPDTKSRIGSITKQFTASAILRLQEEGKLSIKDKLSKFIPDFPRGDEVTLYHLLTHTSGIHSFTNRPAFLKYLTIPVTSAEVVDTIKKYPYDFNPGEKYLYNNSGFFLLGYILEKVSGKSLANYLRDTFFRPLGMNNTGVHNPTDVLDNEAYGYADENGLVTKSLNWDMSWAGGAGSIYSTVKDLYTWNEALFNGKVLSEESLKAAFTPGVLNNGQKTDYGFGFSLLEYRGNKIISHGGGLHGFVSYLMRQPENKVTVVVFCNSTPQPEGINPSTNATLLAEYVLWPEMTRQSSFASDVKVDENILKSYAGRYNYGQGRVLIVTVKGGQLNAQMTGQPDLQLYPSAKDEFNWKVVDARIKFLKDDKGNVIGATHYQGGGQINATKLVDETPVTVNPALFDRYTGKYDLGNNNIAVITREDNKLFVQGTNLPKFLLLPASDTEYFLREMTVRLQFKAEGEAKANALILDIDGMKQTANRIPE